MSRRLDPFSQLMVLMERPSQPMHAGTVQLFRLPAHAPLNFVARLVDSLRGVPARAPFNQVLTGTLLNSWRQVDVNSHYHVRHLRLPAPGSIDQLMEWAENFYGAPLNRSLPLWEVWVLEGVERDRFAIVVKGHHAMIDGQGGMRLFLDAFAIEAKDSQVRAPWGDNTDSRVHGNLPRGNGALAASAVARSRDSANPRHADLVDRARALWPLQGRPSKLNGTPESVARRFGFCNLPLGTMKAVARAHGVTINDLIVTVVDHATHRYLAEIGEPEQGPLVLLMPVSTRTPGATTGGNQVTAVTATLGSSQAEVTERLMAVHRALRSAKDAVSSLPKAAQFGYSALLAGVMPQLGRLAGAFGVPMAPFNLTVSNISPPRGAHYVDHPLYLGGARLEGLYIQPILTGSSLLNVTVAGYNNTLNVGIGSVPAAIDQPMKLGRYMVAALDELAGPSPRKSRTRATSKSARSRSTRARAAAPSA